MKQRQVLRVLALWASILVISVVQARALFAPEPPGRLDWVAPPPGSIPPVGREAIRISSSGQQTVKVEPVLLKQALEGDPGQQYRFIVELDSQANLAFLNPGLSRIDRHRQVAIQLQATARQTQTDLLAYLQERHAEGQVEQIHPFWVFNGLAVTADAETLLAVSARPEVRIVRQDHWRRWVEPLSVSEEHPAGGNGLAEWNISRVRADLVWGALGVDGRGVTVAIMDTGVDWQHPALQMQYRGYKQGGLAIHAGNWWCTTEEGYLYPVDGYGHGTHVAGLAVGQQAAAGQAIGVAPGAQWIAVKMLNDDGFGYDSWIHAAFEWLMAPAGDPALAPDIVNGSWGSPYGDNETFRPDVQALRASGIVAIFAAGNHGPGPSSMAHPASYPESIAVGATDDLDQVTSFSSRGPSRWAEIKPEVVAPGIQVWSSLPGGTYGAAKGTSMATPHVAGLAALLLQADPTLTVDEIESLLASTAYPLGAKVPNNSTGWGRIDAYQAAAAALKAGFLAGRVARYPDQLPLPTAQITVRDHVGVRRAVLEPDDSGHYHVALPPGQYDVQVAAFGYEPQTASGILIQTTVTTSLNLILAPLPGGVLWGQVTNAETGGPVGANISVVGTPAHTTGDPQTGQYSLVLPPGTYTLQTSQNGYRRSSIHGLEVAADQSTRQDMALTSAPTLLLVDSGRWYYESQATYYQQALADKDYVHDLWEIRDLTRDLPGLDDLSRYDAVIWSSPLDAPGLIGAGDVISDYLSAGGNLFISGQDVGFWDDGLSGWSWHQYYERFLKAKALEDNAGRQDLIGLPGEILDGLSLSINGRDSASNQVSPDLIALHEPRQAAVIGRYAVSGDAAVQASGCQSYRAVYLAAGLEGLADRGGRAEVLDRVVTWLDTPHLAVDLELHPPRQDQVWLNGTFMTYTVGLRNLGRITDTFTLLLSPSAWTTSLWDATFSRPITQSLALGACQTQTVGLAVAVPTEVAWDATDIVTLTAHSLAEPVRTAQAVFHSKTPAPILLVDDHRWYDELGRYQTALDANRLPYDVWITGRKTDPDLSSPTLQRLERYPIVVWFTAYDWHQTLTPEDEARLAAYLNGGGRLLLSSQDYLYTSRFTDFATNYLGVAGYTEGLTTTQVLGTVGSPVGNPFGPMELTYPFPNWSDTLRPTLLAHISFWGQHGQPAALTLAQSSWKTAFFAFPLETLSVEDMAAVMGQTATWLSPLGESTLTVDRSVVAEGDQAAYSLRVYNTGPALLSNVALSNTVPLFTSYVAGSLEGPAEYDPTLDRFTWNGALAPRQTATIAYRLQFSATIPPGTIVRNVAQLRDERGFTLERAAVSRTRTPDLAGSFKVASTPIARSGQMLTYTLTLRNDGLRTAYARLVDPIPLHTLPRPDSAWASSGLLTTTAEALTWTGPVWIGQGVTITLPVVVDPTAAGLYVVNRASVDDGWSSVHPLEAFAWVEANVFLPLVFRQQ